MRDLLLQIFKDETGGPKIGPFSLFHFIYLFIIIAFIVFILIKFKNKNESQVKKFLDVISIILIVLYLGDYFVHPFMSGEYSDNLNVDKLPFHLCTVSSIMIALTRIFPKTFAKIKNGVTVLGLIGALMYLTYPNGAFDIEKTYALCYRTIQTVIYHGLLLSYGVFAIALGEIKLDIKKIYIEAILIAILDIASIGANSAYDHDWFFTTGRAFGVSSTLMPFLMFVIIFAMCLAIYGIYYLVKHLKNKSLSK